MVDRDVPTPSLRSLVARADLGLRVESGHAALDRPVRWVHSSDLLDPTPFLSDGQVLLTTGTQFDDADDPHTYDDYVERLHARGVAGLGFGTEVVRAGIPAALADACRARGMPLFEVPYRTPFIALARAHAEAIAAQAYARRNWALSAQRAISHAALRPDGLAATIDELARQLDAWVGLFDANGVLTHEHPVSRLDAGVLSTLRGDVDTVLRRGARAASSVAAGDTAFTLQTLGRGGHLRGVIAISGSELDHEERGVVTAVIAMAGLALEQHQGLARARRSLRAGLVHALRAGDVRLARRVARELWGGLPAAPVHVVAADVPPARADALAQWLELRAIETHGAVFSGPGENGLLLVVPARDDGSTGPGEAEGGVDLDDLAARFDLRLGVSTPAGYADFARSEEQALLTLARGSARVSVFGDIAREGLLRFLPEESRLIAAGMIEPLRAHDERFGTELVDTVRAHLEHDGRHETTARALGVHRHTVRSRIQQAEGVLGHELTSFASRARLWLALEALGSDIPPREP